jgi:hypothetical protein
MRGAGIRKTLRSSSSAITRAASCLLANPITKSCAYLTSRACGASFGLAVCLNLVPQPLAVQLDPEAQPAHLRQELLVELDLGRGPLRKALVARNADLVQHDLGRGARLPGTNAETQASPRSGGNQHCTLCSSCSQVGGRSAQQGHIRFLKMGAWQTQADLNPKAALHEPPGRASGPIAPPSPSLRTARFAIREQTSPLRRPKCR